MADDKKKKKKLPEAPKMPKEVKKMRNASRERTERPPESAYEEMGYRDGGLIRKGTFKGIF